MTNRPEPRRSSLSGLSPVSPTSTSQTPPPKTSASWDKITIRLDAELAGRARAAFWATAHVTGCRSLSEWVAQAIADKLAQQESEFNSGIPYAPVPAGTIPTGRRS
jgi:hypothetical protein